jgi:hypothetical protein
VGVAFDEGWSALRKRDLVHGDAIEEKVLVGLSSVDGVCDVASLGAEIQIPEVEDLCVIWKWPSLEES